MENKSIIGIIPDKNSRFIMEILMTTDTNQMQIFHDFSLSLHTRLIKQHYLQHFSFTYVSTFLATAQYTFSDEATTCIHR